MIQDIPYAEISIGDKASISKTITESDVYGFAEISMDFNPIHVDQEYAKTTQFKQRVAHGILSAGLVSAVIGTALPGKNTIYLGQTLKFTAPVFIGDTLTARVEVTEKIEAKNILKLKTEVLKQDGTVVVEGEATVLKK